MADFQKFIEPLIKKEGGYKLIEIPGDRGGRTYAGISERANPHWDGWELLEKGVSPAVVQAAVHSLYRHEYWDPIYADYIDSDKIVEAMLSCAVLSGPNVAIKLAQLCLNSSGVAIDGIMGPVTANAINNHKQDTPQEIVFILKYGMARIARFSDIIENDKETITMEIPSQLKFFRGWVNRVLKELKL